VVSLGGVEVVVSGLAGEVDAEGDESDSEAGCSTAEVVNHQWVAPPFVPSPEELSGRSQRFRHWCRSISFRSLLSLLFSSLDREARRHYRL
jgi:hypothetical protein